MKNVTIQKCLRHFLTLAATLNVASTTLADDAPLMPVFRFAVYDESFYPWGDHSGIAIDSNGHVYAWHLVNASYAHGWCDAGSIVKFEMRAIGFESTNLSRQSIEISDIGKYETLAMLAVQDDAELGDDDVTPLFRIRPSHSGQRCFAYFQDVPDRKDMKKRYLLAVSGELRPGNERGKQVVTWLKWVMNQVNPERMKYTRPDRPLVPVLPPLRSDQ